MKLQARNETTVNAPVIKVWELITDIRMLPTINPGVISATGRMDLQGETRVCEINNRGRTGTMTERLIELVPHKKTVWTIEYDTMGMGHMLRDTRFVFKLEPLGDHLTKITSETWYVPRTFLAAVMNRMMMKGMIAKAQEKILSNIDSILQS